MKSIRLSLGVVPTLIIAAAASTLAGCSGGGAEGAPAATAGSAGMGSAESGGSGGSAGSSGKSGSGATGGGEETGGTSGGASAGSGGKSGTGGSGSTGSGGSGSGGSGGSGSSASGGTGGADVNDGEYSRAEFAVADPDLADPFHPFEQRETTLLRREEVAVYSPTGNAVDGFMLDHPQKAFADLNASPGKAFAGMTTFDMTAANIDDDGNDELVGVGAVTGGLSVRVADSDAFNVFGGQAGFDVPGTFEHAWIEAADVDEDGRDEILVAAVTSTGVVAKLFDDATALYAPLGDVKSGAGQEIAATFGNFDGDRFPELAILTDEGSTLKLELLDDARAGWASLGSISEGQTGLVDQWGLDVRGLMLEAGNLDGDAQDELVLFVDGISADTNNGSVDDIQSIGIDVTSVTGGVASFGVVAGSDRDFPAPNENNYRYTNRFPWSATLADSNDDGVVESFVVDRYFGDNTVVVDLFHEVYGTDAKSWTVAPSLVTLDDDVVYNAPVHLAKVTGRSNGLGSDVIAVVRDDTTLGTYRVTLDTTEIPSTDPLKESTFSFTQRMETLPARTIASANDQVFAAGGDWDADSLRLRFTGEKWMALARPRPIVILAAPPAKAGISQNYDETTTSYAVSATNSSSKGNEFSVSDKVTLSFEVSFPGADFISAGASASMSQQFTKTQTKTQSITYGKEFGGAYPKDVIVFNGTLCARYRYEVLSGGDGAEVGSFMTIDVPQETRIYKWTVEYYNKALEGVATPIDDKVLAHTVGDPASYMTASAKNQLKTSGGAWAWPVASPVGQGAGADTVYIAVGEEVSDESATTVSTEYSGKAGAFVSAEYTRGYDDTKIYSVSVAKETVFTGTIGDIDLDDDYESWRYSYGLVVYPTTLAGGEAVRVVTYWTEGLIGDGYSQP